MTTEKRACTLKKPGTPSRFSIKTVYNPDLHDEKLYTLLRCGLFKEHFCADAGISAATFNLWLEEHETFREAHARGFVAGHAEWAGKVNDEIKMPFQYWNTIMNNYFKQGRIVLPKATNEVDALSIVNIAQNAYVNGEISNTSLDRMLKIAETRIKVEENIKLKNDVATLTAALNAAGIKLSSNV